MPPEPAWVLEAKCPRQYHDWPGTMTGAGFVAELADVDPLPRRARRYTHVLLSARAVERFCKSGLR